VREEQQGKTEEYLNYIHLKLGEIVDEYKTKARPPLLSSFEK